MADHTTTTTTTTTVISADAGFVKSPKGICLIVEWAMCLIVLICIGAGSGYYTYYGGYGGWTYFTCITWMIIAGLWFILFLFRLQDRIGLPWNLLTLVVTCIWTLFMFISACLCATLAARIGKWGYADRYYSGFAAAAAFAFFSLPVFGFHIFLLFKDAPINVRTSNTNTGGPA